MKELGIYLSDFLQQAKSDNCENWDMNQFQVQFNTYSDLKVMHFESILSKDKYAELLAFFDPEIKLWNEIQTLFNNKERKTILDIEDVMRNVAEYERNYPEGKFITEAKKLLLNLEQEKTELMDWLGLKKILGVD